MAHRTHPTQQDEALRQARADGTIRDSLRWIADRLRHRKPQHLMSEAARLAIALSAACITHPYDDDAAEQLERDLLLRMPYADTVTTRGEYALKLDRITWSGR